MAVALKKFAAYCNDLLNITAWQDYAPNGLQVEGKAEIQKVVCGVTASMALIEKAIEQSADAIVVHHGYFWKGEDPRLLGMKGQRIRRLMQNDISLIAYHLPLDAHPQYGNNAGLAKAIGLDIQGGFAGSPGQEVAVYGEISGQSPLQLQQQLEQVLGRSVLAELVSDRTIRRLGLCTGGAQGFIEQAADLGLDAYITGEVSEQTIHIARERGIHFYACGHHATERFGPMALAEHLNTALDIDCEFIDDPNPA